MHQELSDRFRVFAEQAVRGLPLYHHLALGVAADPDVLDLVASSPPTQHQPVLLFAAVHDLLLAGEPSPLRSWYASVVEEPRPVGSGAADPWPWFRQLALEHPEVPRSLHTRTTQTNEVGRSPLLRAALATLPGGPGAIGLVELGASAGLNLLVDRHDIRLVAEGEAGVEGEPEPAAGLGSAAGSPAADRLVISCRQRGPRRPPVDAPLPAVVHRVGVDLAPVSVLDPVQTRWLEACLWPEDPVRLGRLRRAVALARTDPPRLVAGDLVEQVEELVAEVPAEALPVLVSTWCLAYLTEERRGVLLDRVERLARGRDLSFVVAELPREVPGLAVPSRPDGTADGRATALWRWDWRAGECSAARLGDAHPHGTWLQWLVDEHRSAG